MIASLAQLEERLPCKQRVAGSIPATGSTSGGCLAQLAERRSYKARVGSSRLSAPTTHHVAEWLCTGLQIRLCGFDSRRGVHAGGVAQLGEHLPCKQEVAGSTPVASTRWPRCRDFSGVSIPPIDSTFMQPVSGCTGAIKHPTRHGAEHDGRMERDSDISPRARLLEVRWKRETFGQPVLP